MRWVVLACVLLAMADRAQAALRAGAAMVKITPPPGTLINGGINPSVAREVHDDLYARCLVLDDGRTKLAIVIIDTCLIDRPILDQAKAIVQRQTGIAPASQLMSATHTHSAGAICGVHLTDADQAYRTSIPALAAEAVEQAAAKLAPAQIAWGRGSVPQHVFCRRILLRPGSSYVNQLGQGNQLAKMNWDSPHPDDLDFAGPVDPEVSVVSVRHADGRPLSLLANYSLHYVGDVGPGHISADYFGVFCRMIAERLNVREPDFVAMMSNGTSGDINNNDFRVRRSPAPPYTRINQVAGEVADEVQKVLGKLTYQSEVKLESTVTELTLLTRRPTADEAARAKRILDGRTPEKLSGWTDNYARETLILADYPPSVAVPLQVIRIGDLRIAAWPGEIFASTGLELKKSSPAKPLFNVSLANGWYGYIPPPEQHALGAYETWLARTSFLETQATVKMIEVFLKMLAD